MYSTWVGGPGFDQGNGIALDATNQAYITGQTEGSPSAFSPGAPLLPVGGGQYDGFISVVNATGNALTWGSFIGGSGADYGTAIAVDTTGASYVTGYTNSTTAEGFPITGGAFQQTNVGVDNAFVTKFAAGGGSLAYSTFLGGSGTDEGFGIAVDGKGQAHVVGQTSSTDFPVLLAVSNTFGGTQNAFVTKLSAAGSSLVYSTYLGGSGRDSAMAVAVDSSNIAYIAGQTTSTNFPVVGGLQATNAGSSDAFVATMPIPRHRRSPRHRRRCHRGAPSPSALRVAAVPVIAGHCPRTTLADL